MIKVHATGSTGNLYQVGDNLLIEAGLPIREIRRRVGGLSSIDACLISHAHGDHAKAARDLMRAGVDCYMTAETAETIGADGHRLKVIRPGKRFSAGGFSVVAFGLEHDCPGHVGYLIVGRGEKIAYITDTMFCAPKFAGLTRIMIEANYDADVVAQNVDSGVVVPAVDYRTTRAHMDIETAIRFVLANKTQALKEIHLIHLSGVNANPDDFKARMRAATGLPVFVAERKAE